MTFLEAAGLGVRLFSISLFLSTISMFESAAAYKLGVLSEIDAKLLFGVAMVTFVIALLLYAYPLSVARKLVPRPEEPAIAMTGEAAWHLGCSLVGLYVLAGAIPSLVGTIVKAMEWHRAYGREGDWKAVGNLAQESTQTGVGILLLVGTVTRHRWLQGWKGLREIAPNE